MVLRSSFNFIRKLYLNSSFYNKKISEIDEKTLDYRPSLSIISCIIKYEKEKNKIEDYYLNSIWEDKEINESDYNKLHSFFWLFTLDLKSSKKLFNQ